MYLNVYAVTRHYGGPEEGGWWYNWYTHILGICVTNLDGIEKTRLEEFLYKCYPNEGNIYSIRGGTEYEICYEETLAESQTKEKPYYE